MKLTNIASLDPVITGSGRKGLEGASAADRAMWEEMQSDWEGFAVETQHAVKQFTSGKEPQAPLDDEIALSESDYTESDYTGTN